MQDFLSDLRYAARGWRKHPGFAAIAIVLLALGIGANGLVFSLIDGILLRPLPFHDPARLAAIWETTRTWDPKVFASYRDLEAFKRGSRSFESLGGWQWVEYTLTGRGDPRRILGEAVTGGFFETLGVAAARGRTAGDVVLSDAGWKSMLGGAPDAVGQSLTLDGRAYTVAGVMPAGFEFYPRQALFWVLLTPEDAARQGSAKAHSMAIVGRLRAGVSMAAAESELAGLRTALEKDDPDVFPHAGIMVASLRDEMTWLAGRGLRAGLLLLFGSVAVLLLIACGNVASLLIGRALERRREIAIRAALGSGRGRLTRQFLAESLLLSMAGTLAGLALAYGGLRLLLATQPLELPIGTTVSLNWQVVAFATALAVVTAVLAGLLPALGASGFQLMELLKEGGRGGSPGLGARMSRSTLVVFEAALSLTLLTGAALLVESLLRLRAEPMGYRIEGLLTARIELPKATYPALTNRVMFCERLSATLAAIPGIQAALRSGGLVNVEIAGGQGAAGENGMVSKTLAGPNYLRVSGIPLLAGRDFAAADAERSEAVAIVDREFARRFLPGGNPLGQHIRLGDAASPWRTVVGEAGDVKETNPFDEMHWRVTPHAYLPIRQGDAKDGRQWNVVIRAGPRWLGPDDQPLETLVSALRRGVGQVDPSLPLSEVTSMRQFLNQYALSKPGLRAALLAVFAALALIMAAIGLYGVLTQLVVERRHEIGIRRALGATTGKVVRLVVGRSLMLTAVGILLGSLGAVAALRLLRTFLITGPGRPLVLAGVGILMILVALAAAMAPAWRAARVDPAVALRGE